MTEPTRPVNGPHTTELLAQPANELLDAFGAGRPSPGSVDRNKNVTVAALIVSLRAEQSIRCQLVGAEVRLPQAHVAQTADVDPKQPIVAAREQWRLAESNGRPWPQASVHLD
jgi:hypothetical protein